MNEWISVKKWLPKKGTEVLVAGRGPSKTILFIAMYTTYGWDSCDEAFEGHKVTHWMPLPEPPKEEVKA